MRKKVIENVIAFALFAMLMICGTDSIESIYKGIWHVLNDVGLGRTASEMVSACMVLWSVMEFAQGAVHFFFGLADKKSEG